jgi:hypothetical protein
MEDKIYNLRIDKVLNGYIVYVNDNHINLNNAPTVPYVFESMDTLTEFINKKLKL